MQYYIVAVFRNESRLASQGMAALSRYEARGKRQEARGKTDSGIVGMAMSSGSIDRRTDHMRC